MKFEIGGGTGTEVTKIFTPLSLLLTLRFLMVNGYYVQLLFPKYFTFKLGVFLIIHNGRKINNKIVFRLHLLRLKLVTKKLDSGLKKLPTFARKYHLVTLTLVRRGL